MEQVRAIGRTTGVILAVANYIHQYYQIDKCILYIAYTTDIARSHMLRLSTLFTVERVGYTEVKVGNIRIILGGNDSPHSLIERIQGLRLDAVFKDHFIIRSGPELQYLMDILKAKGVYDG